MEFIAIALVSILVVVMASLNPESKKSEKSNSNREKKNKGNKLFKSNQHNGCNDSDSDWHSSNHDKEIIDDLRKKGKQAIASRNRWRKKAHLPTYSTPQGVAVTISK